MFFHQNMRTFFGLWKFGAKVLHSCSIFFVVFLEASWTDKNLACFVAFDVS
jgi:hypothetical protein